MTGRTRKFSLPLIGGRAEPEKPRAPEPQRPGESADDRGSRQVMLKIGDDRSFSLRARISGRFLVGRADEGQMHAIDLNLSRFAAAEKGVSRVHAAMLYREGELFLEDLGSTNGTRINGYPVEPHRIYRLRSGDELEFGLVRMSIHFED